MFNSHIAPIIGVILAWSMAFAQPSAPPDPESIGSLRGARIAYQTDGKPIPLTYIAAGLSDDQLADLKPLAPNVTVINVDSREGAFDHAAEAHGVDARLITSDFLGAADRLVWAQSPSAGVNWILENEALRTDPDIVLTNMRAVHGPAIADHAFAMLLTLTRSMRIHDANKAAGTWDRSAAEGKSIALKGRTMFVVGLGGIGSEIAKRAHGFGMRVIATRRSDQPRPDYVDEQGLSSDFARFLPQADVVAICLPLTDETEHLFDKAAFDAMKPGAYLINIARGRIVDTDALLAALDSGRLAGACLDVTDPEPLPAGHPLWSQPNVVITPHTAADATLTDERWWALYRENIRRFGAGEPLLNTVDKQAGY
jgi:phosphoglycerate dehydrogenase-like enzyme